MNEYVPSQLPPINTLPLLRVAARLSFFTVPPIVVGALGALGPTEAELREGLHGVEPFGVFLELGASQGLDLL